MKRNKFLTILLGIAVLSGILCSGIIIGIGIQRGKTISANISSVKKEQYPQAYQLEKTEIPEFSEISLQLDYSNVKIIPSDGYYLEYRLDGTQKEPVYGVSNGKFQFQEGDVQQKYQFSFHLFGYTAKNQEPFYLNLYVPKGQAFDLLTANLESGNFEFEELEVKKAELSLGYGNLKFDKFTGESFTIAADSGNLEMGDVACDDLQIKAEYGNVKGNAITVSNQADLELDSGNLELSQMLAESLKLSNEYGNCTVDSFQVENSRISMDSGNLKLWEAAFENTEIESEYGNIDLTLAGNADDYNYDVDSEYGSLKIGGKTVEADEDGSISYTKYDKEKKSNIRIHCEDGNVDIR